MSVISFRKTKEDYGWFSNMRHSPIWFKGEWFPTAEHLFQFMRYEGMHTVWLNNERDTAEWIDEARIRKEVLNEASPLLAKHVAKKYRKYWTTTKEHDLYIMNKVVRWKVAYHPDLIRLLLATGDEQIIENETRYIDDQEDPGQKKLVKRKSPPLWGMTLLEDGSWYGENNLGKIWMQLRDELRKTLICTDEINYGRYAPPPPPKEDGDE